MVQPSHQHQKADGPVAQIQEKVMTFLSPYRSYLDTYSSVIHTKYIVNNMVAGWVNAIAGTFAWMALGAMVSYAGVGGRGFDGSSRSEDDEDTPRPWEDFGPDAETVSLIFQGMADVAARWHDEL